MPRQGTPVRRLAVSLAIVVAVLVLTPYVIAPFYRFIDPVSTPMLWRWATGQRVERIVLPLNRIAPPLRLSVIVAEDGSFCRNPGIDLGAIRDALRHSDDLGEARGASDHHPADRQEPVPMAGPQLCPQSPGIPARALAQLGAAKTAGAGDLSQYRRMGPERRIRRRSRRPLGIRQIGTRLSAYQAAELAAILPNPVLRSARTPGALVRRLAALYDRRATAFGTLDSCVRDPDFGH